jgi:predicted outer membrane protein
MLRKSSTLLVVAGLLSCNGIPAANGQDVRVETPQAEVDVDRPRDRPARTPQPNSENSQIARWLIADQANLVELARYGLERSKTPEVRQLAETVVQEHQSLREQLAAVAGDRTRPTWTRSEDEINRDQRRRFQQAGDRAEDAAEDRREAAAEARQDTDRLGDDIRRPLENLTERLEQGAERVADRTQRAVENTRDAVRRELNDDDRPTGRMSWVNVHRDIVNMTTEIAKKDLEQREGKEFDGAFVGMLAAAHLQQEATLEVLSGRASDDFADTLQTALQTVRQHRQKAEQVMGEISR